jgi:hypothetical protein
MCLVRQESRDNRDPAGLFFFPLYPEPGPEKCPDHREVRQEVAGDARGGESGGAPGKAEVDRQLVRKVWVDTGACFEVSEEFPGGLFSDRFGPLAPLPEGRRAGKTGLCLRLEENERPGAVGVRFDYLYAGPHRYSGKGRLGRLPLAFCDAQGKTSYGRGPGQRHDIPALLKGYAGGFPAGLHGDRDLPASFGIKPITFYRCSHFDPESGERREKHLAYKVIGGAERDMGPAGEGNTGRGFCEHQGRQDSLQEDVDPAVPISK